MREVKLSDIANRLDVKFEGNGVINKVVTDSRECTPGSLFIAIVGENADGNNYTQKALENGAEAAVVSRIGDGVDPDKVMLVADTKRAMIEIGGLYRDRFDIPFVGVTGSVGKTTTKEFVYAVLSAKYNTHKNEGNRNNEIGVPNTLFDLSENHEAAVIEMGMSGLGEIHDLTMAVRPCAGIITTVGVSHLEHLGTRENILKAKLEIIDGMPEGAPLLICGDNDLLSTVKSDKVNIIRFGVTNPECDIRADEIEERDSETFFTIHSPWGEYSARIPILGRHNVVDALSAFGIGCVMGVEPEKAAMALSNYLPTGMRQNVVVKNGVTVIEDCYNSAPDSLKAAALTFSSMNVKKRRFLIVSDMLELGTDTKKLHAECGEFIAKLEIDALLAFGELSRSLIDAAQDSGLERAAWYETKQELSCALKDALRTGDAAWFKASRGQRLEEVISSVFEEEVK